MLRCVRPKCAKVWAKVYLVHLSTHWLSTPDLWKKEKGRYPHLAQLAKKVLGVPSSSAPVHVQYSDSRLHWFNYMYIVQIHVHCTIHCTCTVHAYVHVRNFYIVNMYLYCMCIHVHLNVQMYSNTSTCTVIQVHVSFILQSYLVS